MSSFKSKLVHSKFPVQAKSADPVQHRRNTMAAAIRNQLTYIQVEAAGGKPTANGTKLFKWYHSLSNNQGWRVVFRVGQTPVIIDGGSCFDVIGSWSDLENFFNQALEAAMAGEFDNELKVASTKPTKSDTPVKHLKVVP